MKKHEQIDVLNKMMKRLSLDGEPLPVAAEKQPPEYIKFQQLEKLFADAKQQLDKVEYKGKAKRKKYAEAFKNVFDKLMAYQKKSEQVYAAGRAGSATELFRVEQPFIMRCVYFLNHYHENDFSPLSSRHAKRAAKGLNLFARKIKTKKAYQRIRTGKKFLSAKIIQPIDKKKSLAAQELPNPIAVLSKKNISNLIEELGTLAKTEKQLLAFIIEKLPLQAQHATPSAYPITNAGSLDSYIERQRSTQGFQSAFSTPGNVRKLGNNSFVFFRCFVEGQNGENTRYGAAKFILPLDAIATQGWVSLHDQLRPVSIGQNDTMSWSDKKLRTVEVVAHKTGAKSVKNMHDGLQYTYTTKPLFGDAKKQKNEKPNNRTISFADEIFYGNQIKFGLALSLVRELRYLKASGFQEYVFNRFNNVNNDKKISLVGKLLRRFFRIEAKFPVSLPLQVSSKQTQARLRIPGSTTNTTADIVNPAGNHAFDAKNRPVFGQTYLANIEREIELKKTRVRFDGVMREQVNMLKIIRQQLIDIDDKVTLDNVAKKMIVIGDFFMPLVIYAPEKYIADLLEFSHEKLTAMANYEIIEGLCDNYFPLADFHQLSTKRIQLLSQHYYQIVEMLNGDLTLSDAMSTIKRFIDYPQILSLLENDLCRLDELALLEVDEMIALENTGSLATAFIEYDQTLSSLLDLYRKNHWHLTCLTTEDLTDLVLEEMPDVPTVLQEYADERDVDMDWILEQTCESEQILYQMNSR